MTLVKTFFIIHQKGGATFILLGYAMCMISYHFCVSFKGLQTQMICLMFVLISFIIFYSFILQYCIEKNISQLILIELVFNGHLHQHSIAFLKKTFPYFKITGYFYSSLVGAVNLQLKKNHPYLSNSKKYYVC